uniref:Uncharacterized protein n=1 Tax=Zea mays TaxID=4577 RepID=C4J764_MAIZE|nr:unknown [Zea mays]
MVCCPATPLWIRFLRVEILMRSFTSSRSKACNELWIN